jgi:hypothetical protein
MHRNSTGRRGVVDFFSDRLSTGGSNCGSIKAMRINPLRHRSAGERAFDQCMILSAVAVVLSHVGAGLVGWSWRHSFDMAEEGFMTIEPTWEIWLPFALGILLGCFWIRVVQDVLRSWSDPVARFLRFSSLVILLIPPFLILPLLQAPWFRPFIHSD